MSMKSMTYTPSRRIDGLSGPFWDVSFGYRAFALRGWAFGPVGSCRSFSPISHSGLRFKSKWRYA